MRSNWVLTTLAAGVAFAGGLLAGCQTYDFEPVTPLSLAVEDKEVEISARVFPPNLVLLVDKSDSMDRPENPDNPACKTGNPAAPICGTGGAMLCDEVGCPTRLSRLREALAGFLAPTGGAYPFRVALAAYPVAGQCSPTPRLFVDLPATEDAADLTAKASEVNAYIQSIRAEDGDPNDFNYGDRETAGGTPTAESLRFVRNNVAQLKDTTGGRRNFVLLLTDGLPNCNSQHPYDKTAPQNPCRCTLVDPTQCEFAKEGCLDDRNTVGAIEELAADGVQTIVVGLGAETATGLGPETLDAMGAAGGFARTCSVNADCGDGDTCNSGVCAGNFYQASDGAALGAALRRIAENLMITDPCRINLTSAPSESELIFVKVDGEKVPATDGATVNWVFAPSPTPSLTFQGAICARIEASSPANPVSIKVSVVQSR